MAEKLTVEQASQILSKWMADNPDRVIEQKAAVERYGKYFSPVNLENITADGFRDFLQFRNNQHWKGMVFYPVYQDIKKLRKALRTLLDETRPIQDRLDKITDKNGPLYIEGLSRAVLTPVLLCVYPEKYAAYNRVVHEALIRLGYPPPNPKDSFGARYVAVNNACQEIATQIGQPLQMLPMLFWLVWQTELPNGVIPPDDADTVPNDDAFVIPVEKFLENFLIANWHKTTLGKSMNLHKDDEGDEDESATQYHTDVGYIDILARDKSTHDWVVIELKKGKSSDQVVGQILKYMGWIKKHKATHGETVRGIIITGQSDDKIKYAMLVTQGISFYTYRLTFELNEEAALAANPLA